MIRRAGRLRNLCPTRSPSRPEEPVEAPDQTVAIGAELIEIQVVVDVRLRSGVEALHRSRERDGKPRSIRLTQIDSDLSQRKDLPLRAGRAPHHHRVAEVGFVLNPVEVNPQGRGHLGIEDAVFDERHQRPCDQSGHLALRRTLAIPGLLALRNMIDMDDHRNGRSYVVQSGIGVNS